MFRVRHLTLLIVFFAIVTASGQIGPIVTVEHDWCLHYNGRLYGLYQTRMAGDAAGSYTGLYWGKCILRMNSRAEVFVALTFFVLPCCALLLSARSTQLLTRAALKSIDMYSFRNNRWLYWRLRHAWSILRFRRRVLICTLLLSLLAAVAITRYCRVYSSHVLIDIELDNDCKACF